MTIRIYNTLGRKKQPFTPIMPETVRMYVCGPTVYDACHIGHARSAVVFDVIARYFRAVGFSVTYVRNFTDIDDKIISRANELGIPPLDLAERYIREFYEDMDALGVLRADIEPRVTDLIEPIIEFVGMLVDKGLAYAVDGDVFYRVTAFPGYGKLSGRKLEDMAAGARVDVDNRKEHPFDFALWKSAKPGEPAWDSPWGSGRPGWHIECSAMSWKHLGPQLDIHGGGKDLIFPHHENEIAQSEGVFGRPFARYWVHNGFVNIDQEKMSKSLGNFLLIRDVLKRYPAEAVRLFLLSNHYRSPIDFTDRAMDEAVRGLDRIYTFLERAEGCLGPEDDSAPPAEGPYWDDFTAAMDDDFNTAQGIGALFEAIRSANVRLDDNGASPEPVRIVRAQIRRIGGILGLAKLDPAAYFDGRRAQSLADEELDPAEIDGLVRERSEARRAKNFARADEIRDQLAARNIVLEDRPDGTVWKVGG
jgi:cysteinyl-tRNA synthetase